METYITICKIDSQWEFAVCLRKLKTGQGWFFLQPLRVACRCCLFVFFTRSFLCACLYPRSPFLMRTAIVLDCYLLFNCSVVFWLFWHPMGCSPLDCSVHVFFQARILEWVAISFSRGSSQPRDRTYVSWIGKRILYTEPPGKLYWTRATLLNLFQLGYLWKGSIF